MYAVLVGLISFPLRTSLIVWPIWMILFWFLFGKFNLLRFSGYLALLPLSILIFEAIRTAKHPAGYAFQYLALDRSHYMPGTRVIKPNSTANDPQGTENKVKEILIGGDGFRADPETGRGNPPRCHEVLVGDSMIYGSGLPYSHTLRPVLETMGLDACVFGVTGNSPVDYLATLDYVKARIESGARVAIYVYVYNDFISLTKYMGRATRGRTPSFIRLASLINYYDEWRRTTYVQGFSRKFTATPKRPFEAWHLKIGERKEIEVYWPRDPSSYKPAPPLDQAQRAIFRFFLQKLHELAASRPWRISIVFIPDNEEVLANLAHASPTFKDLDQKRIEGLKICTVLWSNCHDLTPYLYKRVVAEGLSPYLLKDRHFSLFGNRSVAEHYRSSIAKPDSPAEAPNPQRPRITRAKVYKP